MIVTKVAEIIKTPTVNAEPAPGCLVSGEVSLQEAAKVLLENGANCLGVQLAQAQAPILITREHLLEELLKELDQIQGRVNDLQGQLEKQMASQVELMEIGAACIAESEKNRLITAVKSMTEGMILVNSAGQIELTNIAARKMLGLNESANLGDIGQAVERMGFRQLAGLADCDPQIGREFDIRSESMRLLRVRWNHMKDEWGRSMGQVIFMRDITDEVAAENTKNDFITAISHELRTPLTSIQNSVSNMLAGVTGKIADKTRDYLETMKGDCHRFADLINDLLDMAKLEAGNMPVARRVMSLENLVRNTIKEFAQTAQNQGIKLGSEIPHSVTPVYADIRRMRQVLVNLFRNALQFTPTGGQVTVTLFEKEEEIVACVEDTGVGISPELQKLLFTKFYQIARQAGPGSKGSGLGLAICKGILQIHGGSIWLESEPGKGSRFYFSLPKTNPDVILQRHLESLCQEEAVVRGRFGLALIEFAVRDGGEMSQDVRDAAGAMISELLAQSRFLLACELDVALQTADCQAAFIINQFGRQQVGSIFTRIEKMIENRIKKSFSDLPIVPKMALTEYPEEGKSPSELMKTVQNKLARFQA